MTSSKQVGEDLLKVQQKYDGIVEEISSIKENFEWTQKQFYNEANKENEQKLDQFKLMKQEKNYLEENIRKLKHDSPLDKSRLEQWERDVYTLFTNHRQ